VLKRAKEVERAMHSPSGGGRVDGAERTASVTKRLKAGLANTLVVVVTLLVSYAAGEFVFFRFMLPNMPLTLRPYMPEQPDFFLQNAKSHYVPHDYIALVGDSYAAGVGDWLLATGDKKDKPYHSGNVLHELTRRDVITFGRVGAGSAEGMVLRVARILDDGYCYLFPPIEEPSRIYVYFYEGNDLDDNYFLLRNTIAPAAGNVAASTDRFLQDEYARPSHWRCHGNLGDLIFRLTRYAVKFAGRTSGIIDLPPDGRNEAIVAGEPRAVGGMQVPALGQTDAQIDDSVAVYDRSLAWLRRRLPHTPVTVVYLPSPAAVYRYRRAEFIARDVYTPDLGPKVYRDWTPVPVPRIYANSQKICEKILAASLAAGAGFVDARPALRRAAAQTNVHGPRDYNHLNEAGYRTLGTLLASRFDEAHPQDACDDSWP
jgi:hypothetical protein